MQRDLDALHEAIKVHHGQKARLLMHPQAIADVHEPIEQVCAAEGIQIRLLLEVAPLIREGVLRC